MHTHGKSRAFRKRGPVFCYMTFSLVLFIRAIVSPDYCLLNLRLISHAATSSV